MTIGPAPICVKCKHYHFYGSEKISCDAFPKGIPNKIIMTDFIHTKKWPWQKNDIVFEKRTSSNLAIKKIDLKEGGS